MRIEDKQIIISIPQNWTPAEDKQYLEECLGDPNSNYRDYAVRHLEWAIDESNAVLDRAIKYFCKAARGDVREALFLLSPISKLNVIRNLLQQHDVQNALRKRMLDNLKIWNRVMELTAPIFERYVIDPENVWLRELVEAYDWTLTAVNRLEEILECENRESCGAGSQSINPGKGLVPVDISDDNQNVGIQRKRLGRLASESEESSSCYTVTANCDLYAVAEFSLTAATPEEARLKAQQILDSLTFDVAATAEDGRHVAIGLMPENIQLQVITVSGSGGV